MSFVRTPSVLLVASLLCACGGVEGDWQSREKLSNEERNRISFLEGGEGDMKIFAKTAADAPLTKMKFAIGWEIDDEGAYDVTADCKEGCVEGIQLDFEMECVLDGEVDHLDCDAHAPFEGYGYLEFEPMAAE